MSQKDRQGKTAVVVGTITNDVRLFEVPKLSVNSIFVAYFSWGLKVMKFIFADMGLKF